MNSDVVIVVIFFIGLLVFYWWNEPDAREQERKLRQQRQQQRLNQHEASTPGNSMDEAIFKAHSFEADSANAPVSPCRRFPVLSMAITFGRWWCFRER